MRGRRAERLTVRRTDLVYASGREFLGHDEHSAEVTAGAVGAHVLAMFVPSLVSGWQWTNLASLLLV